jgi:V/A-type H+-transporting ATPase subunit I
MAVEPVARVLVAVHKDRSGELLERLQRQGVFHIVRTEEVQPVAEAAEGGRDLSRFEEAIELLDARRGRKGGLLGGDRIAMSRSVFDATVGHYEADPQISEVRRLGRELEELANLERGLRAQERRLAMWQGLDDVPARFQALTSTVVIPGVFADAAEVGRAQGELVGRHVAVQVVATTESGVAVLVVCLRPEQDAVMHLLAGMRFDAVDLRDVDRRPADLLADAGRQRQSVESRRAEIEARLAELVGELPSLKAVADSVLNEGKRAATAAALERTETVVMLSGWVRERDLPTLERLVENVGAAAVSRREPGPGEEPPVALINRKLFRPFELVLDLYSMPRPEEADPTPWLAPFFVVFFGFCLTDAGYGIALVVIAALLMKRMGGGSKLLGMLLIGGLFTIVAGSLVGGWFGDLPDRLGIGPLVGFKNRLMWFDPLVNPMPFFLLSLGMGYAHLMFGMVFEIVDCLRQRKPGDALLGQLPWFVVLNALVGLVLLGGRLPGWTASLLLVSVLASVAAIVAFSQRERELAVGQVLWFGLLWLLLVFVTARLGRLPGVFLHAKWLVLAVFAALHVYSFADLVRHRRPKAVPLALAGVGLATLGGWLGGLLPWFLPAVFGGVFFFFAPANRRVAGKLAWGGYALYGATSYVGVVLSYIRIMALGMVTGGIAMAINTIAWMVTGIPVIGILLALVALIGGHAYNLAVNVLGAFVHTLRLNYVEFFPRFYTGGGEPFTPFREENRYVAVR